MPEARLSLARARGIPPSDVDLPQHAFLAAEASAIHASALSQASQAAGWSDCFRPKGKMLYRTLLGMALQSLQQLTGANYFFYYGATVFVSVGIKDSFITQIILGAVNFFCTFGGLYVMEKVCPFTFLLTHSLIHPQFGRRIPLITGGLWQSAWLFIFAAAGTAHDPSSPSTSPTIGKLMIISACMFILGYATTWAPGVWILIGETFESRTRAKQGALATASNWLWNFLLAFFTPFIVKGIKYRYGFVFASCNLVGAVVVYLFLYESSDLTLENVNLVRILFVLIHAILTRFDRCTPTRRVNRGHRANGPRLGTPRGTTWATRTITKPNPSRGRKKRARRGSRAGAGAMNI